MSFTRNNPRRRNRRRPGKTIIGKATVINLKKSFPSNGEYIRYTCNEKKRRIFMCAPTFSEILYPPVDAAPTISEILSSRIYTLQSIKQRVFDERKLSPSAVDRVPNCFIAAEILELIFLYLPLEDRKNVRLVCKLWNQNCTSAVITKKEKLVFRAHCCVSDITNVLLESSFIRMNLEFHNELINDIPTDAWKIAGHKVNEVNVSRMSRLQDKTLRDIILYCENLTSIKMSKSWEEDTSSDLLDFFIYKRIERARVHTFSTSCKPPNNSISSDTMKKIFLVFPHIKHFYIRNYVGPKIKSSNDSIILHSPTQLESLAYSELSNDCWEEKPVIPVWGTRLTKIQMILTDSISESRIFHFFTVQKELKTIVLRMMFLQDEELAKKLIFHILENCSKLRDFRFQSLQIIKLNGEETVRFFALISNLQCLSTNSYTTMRFEMSALFPRDLALNILCLGRSVEEHSLLYFLKHSAQMRFLYLRHRISDAILLEIFKNMTNLQTLVLNCIDKCTTDGFTGRYPMRHLRKLEHLELRQISPLEKLNIVELAREFKFLPLKHLRLSIDLSSADILSITSNTPTLETVRFDYPWAKHLRNLSVETTVEFCKCLKKLKYLHVELDLKKQNSRPETSLKPLFEACPSLRYVRVDRKRSLRKRNHTRKVYSFNPFTNEVLLDCSNNYFPFPGRKKMEEIKF